MLHIIDGFGTGGAETWLLETVKYLRANPSIGFQFDFLVTSGQKRIYDDEILQQGCQIFYLHYSYRDFWNFRKGFKKILSGNSYVAIHDHQDFISGWHFLLGLGHLPARRISHLHNPYNFVHNYVVNRLRWFSFRAGRLLTYLLTKKITGTSDAVMDEYGYNRWPYKNKRVAPAYCGFATERFVFEAAAKQELFAELNWGMDKQAALFVGRIGLQDYDTAANQKNPVFAFETARELVRDYSDWNFIFVGFKGKLGEELERKLEAEGMAGRIRFLGLRKDVPQIMSASAALLFPSLWEGLGMVAVEAQASGLPVLMSDTVPAEAIIVKEMVKTMSLSESTSNWGQTIANIRTYTAAERIACNTQVLESPFSIQQSVDYLIHLYTG